MNVWLFSSETETITKKQSLRSLLWESKIPVFLVYESAATIYSLTQEEFALPMRKSSETELLRAVPGRKPVYNE
jgi:hypothetical protein